MIKNAFIIILVFVINLVFFNGTYSQNTASTISKDSLIAAGKLTVSLDDFAFDAKFEIKSYNVSALINGYNYEVLNIGSNFSAETLKLITKLKSGQKLYFENIKVKGPDGNTRFIESITYKIK